MADEDQIKRLSEGLDAWNKWRIENPEIQIDLSNADLRQIDLSGINFPPDIAFNLSGANLSGANLQDVDLTKADLSGANFNKANLAFAKLFGANLQEADLTETKMYYANLRIANLTAANLSYAELTKANLSGATLAKAILFQADFKHSNLENANLQEAEIFGSKFNEANIHKANFCKTLLNYSDFSHADCGGTKFCEADFSNTNFSYSNLSNTNLTDVISFKEAVFFQANLSGANLADANLSGVALNKTILTRTILVRANLTKADLRSSLLLETVFVDADLTECILYYAVFIHTHVDQAVLNEAKVFGISVWDLDGVPKEQKNLLITPEDQPKLTVDDLRVAQFIYLLIKNENIRNVIDTITSKAVLILGRFIPERKKILDELATELRKYNLLPIMFDFDVPFSRDMTETIKTLTGLSFFIIADITKPMSSPLELQATIPDFQIPFLPIIQEGEDLFSMFRDLIGKYDWVLPPLRYTSVEDLLQVFKPAILDRAWQKHQELQRKKTQLVESLSIDLFLKKT